MSQSIQDFRKSLSHQEGAPAEAAPKIMVGRPDPQQFYRSYHVAEPFHASLLVVKRALERYLVAPSLEQELAGEFRLYTLMPFINREGDIMLWPITGTPGSWRDSALDVTRQACERWVRVLTNSEQSAYAALPAAMDLGEPQWPQGKTIDDFVQEAFKEHLITSLDHPVVKTLRGVI
ncbi:hypothetical protein LG290_11985 [Halomonas sediminis]